MTAANVSDEQDSHASQIEISRWALIRGGSAVLRSFRGAWRDHGRASWKPWAGTLAAGFIVSILFATAASLVGRHYGPRGLDDWDAAWLVWFVEHNPLSFANAVEFQDFGGSVLLLQAAVAAAVIAILVRRPLTGLTFVLSFFLQKLILFWGWSLWDRPRPDLVAGGIAVPDLRPFPSGHLMQSVAIWGLLVYPWFRASRSAAERSLAVLVVAAICTVVALARFRIGAHWPSDILAGTLLGGVWLAATIAALWRSGEWPSRPPFRKHRNRS
jgi:undecaprenyl-diphosphatase